MQNYNYCGEHLARKIKALAKNMGISIKKMLDDLNLGKNFMVQLSNNVVPGIDKVTLIANYFNVTVDYLLGNECDGIDTDLFWNRFLSLCNERKMTLSEMSVILQTPETEFSLWEKGSLPNETIRKKIARHFDVNPEYLLRADEPKELVCAANLAEIFCRDDLSIYMAHIWEAYTNLFYTSRLITELIVQDRAEDLSALIRYDFLVLYEVLAILNLESDSAHKTKKYTDVYETIVKQAEATKERDDLAEFYQQHGMFFKDARNLAAHYDHERKLDIEKVEEKNGSSEKQNDTFYKSEIKSLNNYTMFVAPIGFNDKRNPLFKKLLIQLYIKHFPNLVDENDSDICIYEKINDMRQSLTNKANALLYKMVTWYFENKDVCKNIKPVMTNAPEVTMAKPGFPEKYNLLDDNDKMRIEERIDTMLEAEKYNGKRYWHPQGILQNLKPQDKKD